MRLVLRKRYCDECQKQNLNSPAHDAMRDAKPYVRVQVNPTMGISHKFPYSCIPLAPFRFPTSASNRCRFSSIKIPTKMWRKIFPVFSLLLSLFVPLVFATFSPYFSIRDARIVFNSSTAYLLIRKFRDEFKFN